MGARYRHLNDFDLVPRPVFIGKTKSIYTKEKLLNVIFRILHNIKLLLRSRPSRAVGVVVAMVLLLFFLEGFWILVLGSLGSSVFYRFFSVVSVFQLVISTVGSD
jgi:hypothetical protein